ncbi:MAG: hypothetical protein HYV07_07355 [Deltaproteobacteria bacterium]|nr:hypothetical protein [Deltaproteobacteria bacterium]
MRNVGPIVLAIALAPFESRAESRDLGDLCWLAPRLDKRRQDRDKLSVVIERAAGNTAPDDVDYLFRYIRATHQEEDAAGARCFAVLTFAEVGPKISVSARRVTELQPVFERELKGPLAALTSATLEPVMKEVWARLAPPPPPPVAEAPKPLPPVVAPAPKAAAFEDPELLKEKVSVEAASRADRGRVAFAVLAGLASRELSGAPGAPIDGAPLFALGVDADLRIDRLARLEGHELEARLGFRRGLAAGQRGDFTVSVDADRFDASLLYRYVLGGKLPRIGLGTGYELLRFELGDRSEALSVRWGVLRLGANVRQEIFEAGSSMLDSELGAFLRFAPGAEGGDADPGFDVGLELRYALGAPFVRGAFRYTHQSADVAGKALDDAFVDLDLAVGVAL